MTTNSLRTLPDLVAEWARVQPQAPALSTGEETLSYRALDGGADRVAAALQRDGAAPRAVVAICAAACNAYLQVFIGALRAGCAVAPLAPGSTPAQLAAMLGDAEATHLFLDAETERALPAQMLPAAVRPVRLDTRDGNAQALALGEWLSPAGSRPLPASIGPEDPFNIIYSSGTTGTPKGIVQPHGMRWAHIRRAEAAGYGPGAVTLIATPLYSNTTLVALIPSLARGAHAVLMPRFDAAGYLALAERWRATHTMLVPVQYQRLMACAEFDRHDLRSFRYKTCTSAPFGAALKAELLRRWPGGLTEYYGLTEGGGTCILPCHQHPDKLHTVGRPAEGHDLRLIDEQGRELPPGSTGEIVGRSPGMMLGYHRRADLTREAEWHDRQGRRYLRTGDIGRFDADGFLILIDRRKDMVISGGFNIYPCDLEAELRLHPAVAEAAVVGVPSAQWGETPVAFVQLRPGAQTVDAPALLGWLNNRVGKTQRLADLRLLAELPRSTIGKVLKRELRQTYLRA